MRQGREFPTFGRSPRVRRLARLSTFIGFPTPELWSLCQNLICLAIVPQLLWGSPDRRLYNDHDDGCCLLGVPLWSPVVTSLTKYCVDPAADVRFERSVDSICSRSADKRSHIADS
jgi:hypothetical protein